MLKKVIEKVIEKKDLTELEMINAMRYIMEGRAASCQITGLLVALRMKGETEEEITGCAKALRDKATPLVVKVPYAIDTCGTGGDKSNTFNVSTASAIVAAAAGVTVVKHGNRSVSSQCGSADVLENLGVNIGLKPTEVEQSIDQLKIGFAFAPLFHQALKHAVIPRKELGIRTIFNLLGPLANPAKVKGQVLGVFDKELTETMAEVLKNIGLRRAMVVHGLDGLDEITVTAKTKVSELKNGRIENYYLDPRDFGLNHGSQKELIGGSASDNATIIKQLFQGEKGVKRDMLLLNAGAAIYIGEQAKSLEEGVKEAKRVIDEGLAWKKLKDFIAFTKGVGA